MRKVTGLNPISIDHSIINLRPSFGNRSRGIDDPATQRAVPTLVARLVRR